MAESIVDELQWGHASLSVETISGDVGNGSGSLASMGPRFFKRGDNVLLNGGITVLLASMGPRFFKRGDYAKTNRKHRREVASMGPRFFKRGDLTG